GARRRPLRRRRGRARSVRRRRRSRRRSRDRARVGRDARAGRVVRRRPSGRPPARGRLDAAGAAPARGGLMVRIVLADDQELVRTGFRMILRAEADFEVVGEAADSEEAVAQVARLRPDVVLMDIRMPRVDGLAATRRILEQPGRTRVLILTTFDQDEYVFEALRAGASGFLLKTVPAEQLVAGVRDVAAGEALLAPAITRRLIERFVSTVEPDPVPP